jgi:hypothetical protein
MRINRCVPGEAANSLPRQARQFDEIETGRPGFVTLLQAREFIGAQLAQLFTGLPSGASGQ